MLLPIFKNEKRSFEEINKKTGKKFKLQKEKVNFNNSLQEYLDAHDLAYNENIKQIFNYKKLKNSSKFINLILNWWLSFNEKIIPSKINIISDYQIVYTVKAKII